MEKVTEREGAARMGGLRRAYIPVIVVTNHRDKDERLFKDVDTVR